MGPYARYYENQEPHLHVMRKHRDAVKGINQKNVPAELYNAAKGRGLADEDFAAVLEAVEGLAGVRL